MSTIVNKKISSYVDMLYLEIINPYNDGYTTWGYKKDLYDAIFYIEDKLADCSSHGAVETEYLKEQKIARAQKILEGK